MTRAVLKDEAWKKFLIEIKGEIKNPIPILRSAYNTIGFKDIIKHFQAEMGPNGKWQRSQRAIKEGGQTLQDTGNLKKNFLPTNSKRYNKDAILIFNNAPYSGVHDTGSAKRSLPQRKFMYFTNKAMDRIAEMFLDQITKG